MLDPIDRAYNSLVAALPCIASHQDQCNASLDSVKGPLFRQSFVATMLSLGILRKCSPENKKGIILGKSKKSYIIRKNTKASRKRLCAFYNMSKAVDALRAPRSVKQFNEGYNQFADEFRKHKVPLIGRSGRKKAYNREWTYRPLALAKARAKKIRRLSLHKNAQIVDFPGPDMSGCFKTLAKQTGCKTGVQLYKKYHMTIPPEYVARCGCMSWGQYRQGKAGTTAAAENWIKDGPCPACAKAHYSAKHCRITLAHTLPAAPLLGRFW